MKEIMAGGQKVYLFGEDLGEKCPVIWLPVFSLEEGEKVRNLITGNCVLACVEARDWNGDFSPWPAERIFKEGGDFLGNAGVYLKILEQKVITEAEGKLKFPVADRGIAGYSMAGLFAVYCMYHSVIFQRIASVSGSLWFDGWTEYALTSEPAIAKARIYLSLGDREHRTGNPRMAAVKECTETLASFWAERFQVVYEINKGGHFHQPEKRLARGIDLLLQENLV